MNKWFCGKCYQMVYVNEMLRNATYIFISKLKIQYFKKQNSVMVFPWWTNTSQHKVEFHQILRLTLQCWVHELLFQDFRSASINNDIAKTKHINVMKIIQFVKKNISKRVNDINIHLFVVILNKVWVFWSKQSGSRLANLLVHVFRCGTQHKLTIEYLVLMVFSWWQWSFSFNTIV